MNRKKRFLWAFWLPILVETLEVAPAIIAVGSVGAALLYEEYQNKKKNTTIEFKK